MVMLIILVMITIFIIVDMMLRRIAKRMAEKKLRLEREEALDIRLLDSFRKILAIAGYSVDTVETGLEAVGLVRKNDYDFVFTDFKMPEMDGVEVTKAVKHLRPNIDVVLITGYASIQSAVETMKRGAVDYVEKPATRSGEQARDLTGHSIRKGVRLAPRIQHPRRHFCLHLPQLGQPRAERHGVGGD